MACAASLQEVEEVEEDLGGAEGCVSIGVNIVPLPLRRAVRAALY
jgi:hypothetical protein